MKSDGRGSAGAGLGEWVVQRVSAVYVLIFILWLSFSLSLNPITSHSDWLSFSSGNIFRVAALLFILSLLVHAWTGLKSVFLDYVHNWRLRFLLSMSLALVFAGLASWSLIVIGGL